MIPEHSPSHSPTILEFAPIAMTHLKRANRLQLCILMESMPRLPHIYLYTLFIQGCQTKGSVTKKQGILLHLAGVSGGQEKSRGQSFTNLFCSFFITCGIVVYSISSSGRRWGSKGPCRGIYSPACF